jgi:hypothetical protein
MRGITVTIRIRTPRAKNAKPHPNTDDKNMRD